MSNYKMSSISYTKQFYIPAYEYPMWKYKLEMFWEKVSNIFK